MSCPQCRQCFDAGWKFCLYCGSILRAAAGEQACGSCGHLYYAPQNHCTFCGNGLSVSSPSVDAHPSSRPPSHCRRRKALLLGILIPGAGQAYNGRLGQGFLILVTSILIIPWVIGCRQAYLAADDIQPPPSSGSSFFYVFMHGWMAFNALLFIVVVLTVVGVLS